jgi:hypothetical protein
MASYNISSCFPLSVCTTSAHNQLHPEIRVFIAKSAKRSRHFILGMMTQAFDAIYLCLRTSGGIVCPNRTTLVSNRQKTSAQTTNNDNSSLI